MVTNSERLIVINGNPMMFISDCQLVKGCSVDVWLMDKNGCSLDVNLTNVSLKLIQFWLLTCE